jgi:hypothetical protein
MKSAEYMTAMLIAACIYLLFGTKVALIIFSGCIVVPSLVWLLFTWKVWW